MSSLDAPAEEAPSVPSSSLLQVPKLTIVSTYWDMDRSADFCHPSFWGPHPAYNPVVISKGIVDGPLTCLIDSVNDCQTQVLPVLTEAGDEESLNEFKTRLDHYKKRLTHLTETLLAQHKRAVDFLDLGSKIRYETDPESGDVVRTTENMVSQCTSVEEHKESLMAGLDTRASHFALQEQEVAHVQMVAAASIRWWLRLVEVSGTDFWSESRTDKTLQAYREVSEMSGELTKSIETHCWQDFMIGFGFKSVEDATYEWVSENEEEIQRHVKSVMES